MTERSNDFKTILFLICYLMCPFALFCSKENIHYQVIRQEINVIGEKQGYSSKLSFRGKFLKKTDRTLSIYSSELEKISNIRRNDISNEDSAASKLIIHESFVETESFYNEIKKYELSFKDSSASFSYAYEMNCKYLVYLSELELVSYPNADTLLYEINTPINYYLKMDFDTSFSFTKIDTTFSDQRKTYTIRSIPYYRIFMKSGLKSDYEMNSFIPPRLRIFVIPAGTGDEWNYFNNWFLDLISSNTKLNNKSIQQIKSFMSVTDSPEEKIHKAFDYVKKNIRYIAIENGLEGFRPRDVNAILEKKYGDCKDMANLLTQILSYFNMDAHITLISTIDFPFKFNFPCLASGNHAICVVKIGNKRFYLDATDKNGDYYLPSAFIQGQDYFSITGNGGEKGKVETISSQRNLISNHFDLKTESNSMAGEYQSTYSNYSANIFKYLSNEIPTEQRAKEIDKIIDKDFFPYTHSGTHIQSSDSSINISGDAKVASAIATIGSTKCILLHSLIFPHRLPLKIKSHFHLVTYHTIADKYVYNISFLDSVKFVSIPKPFNKELPFLSFHFKITIATPHEIIIEYTYELNKVQLNMEETREYESLNAEIRNIFNQSIQYE